IIENQNTTPAPEVADVIVEAKKVKEGKEHTFTVFLTDVTNAVTPFSLSLEDVTAVKELDYSSEIEYSSDNGANWIKANLNTTSEVTMPEGINHFLVKVVTLTDEEAEDTESYKLQVANVSAEAEILDDSNSIPARLIENAPRQYEVSEGNYAVFELSLDKQVVTTQNVFVELKSDDATANDDFDPQAEFSFDDGAFWQTIDLSAANSFLLEKDTQDFLVRVSIIKDQQADEEIETLQLHAWTQQEQLDLIEAPVLLIDATPKNAVIDFISTDKNPMMEGEEVTFNVVFDRKLEKSQSLSFNVIGLNDTTNDDFLNSGYVSLDNGVTWQEMSLVENKSVNVPAEIQNVLIKVTSLVDDSVEENEAYELSAWFEETSKHAKAVSVTDGTAPKPQVMSVIAMPDPVSEGATTTFEVTLDSKVEREISFPFQLVDGNALAQEDYDTTVEVSFDLGQSWQTVLLASTQDITLPENTDTVLVKVATLTNDEFEQSESFALVVDNVVGNVFINDDDNAEPIANPDTLEINEDEFAESIAVIANDEDPNFDPLVILGTPTSLHGVVTVNDDNSINYQPKADYNGKDIIIYSISDGRGGVATSQVTVEIAAVNDEPRQTERTLTTKEDVEITNINLLEGVTDPEGEALSIIGNPVATNGQLIDAGNGQFTYKPNENYFGDDEILFVVSDGETELNAKIAVTVTPVNDLPTAEIASLTVAEDSENE
ncbi:MAG: tandem-95 repeat protein, partial [Pseudoalteromonas spongiae]